MENNTHIGIYITRKSAQVAVVHSHGHSYQLRESFCVSAEESDSSLGAMIVAKLCEMQIDAHECNVAIDSSMFTQHNLYSDFVDVRQISQTIDSDAEEAMGMDVGDYAITFSLINKYSNGSRVNVFAANKADIKQIILDLSSNGLDPVTVEPDAVCLGRCLCGDVKLGDGNWAFAIFSQETCYICLDTAKANQPYVRSILCNSSVDKLKLLARELPRTFGMPGLDQKTKTVFVNQINEVSDFAASASLEVKDVFENLANTAGVLAQQEPSISVSIAAGAAMVNFVRCPLIDFRKRFMPYQGRKKVMEFSLRIIGIAVAIFLLALAFNSTSTYLKIGSGVKEIEAKIKSEYSSAMKGRRISSAPAKDLKSELSKLKRIKSGDSSGDDTSVPARVLQVLEAINKTQSGIGLKIKTVSVSESSVRVDGSTSSRGNTQKLLAEFRKHKKLKVAQETLKQVGPEDTFMITLEPLR